MSTASGNINTSQLTERIKRKKRALSINLLIHVSQKRKGKKIFFLKQHSVGVKDHNKCKQERIIKYNLSSEYNKKFLMVKHAAKSQGIKG